MNACTDFNAEWRTDGALKHRWICKWCRCPLVAKSKSEMTKVWQRYVAHWDEFRKTELGIPNVD